MLSPLWLILLLGGVASSSRICTTCKCSNDNVIDCKDLNLDHHFNDTDWNETQTEIGVKVAMFDYNNLVHVLPFPKLPLVKLSLSHNRIAMIEDMSFRDLQDLVELDLSHNHLTSDILSPHVFKGRWMADLYEPLGSLKILRLGSNALHTLHPDVFEHLPKLESLFLDSNPFTVLDRSAIQAIVTPSFLKFLDLSYMGLEGDIPDRMLHTPRFLEELNLKGNRFTRVPRGLEDAINLKKLNLNNNLIRAVTTHRPFPKLPELTSLSLSWMPNLTHIEAGALGTMPKLTEFICNFNQELKTIDSAAFSRIDDDGEARLWPPVTKLQLNNNRLKYLDNSLLSHWDSMEYLNLQDNPWVCDCENQWLVSTLAKIIETRHPEFMANFVCEEPVEMRGKSIASLESRNYHMRCLDTHGNRPEKDGSVLIGVLIGSLLAIPVTMTAVYLWRRYRGHLCPGGGPADYSRAFYSRADRHEDL